MSNNYRPLDWNMDYSCASCNVIEEVPGSALVDQLRNHTMDLEELEGWDRMFSSRPERHLDPSLRSGFGDTIFAQGFQPEGVALLECPYSVCVGTAIIGRGEVGVEPAEPFVSTHTERKRIRRIIDPGPIN